MNCDFQRGTKAKTRATEIPGIEDQETTYLSRSDLNVEVVSLVGDFENLGPGKAVYSQAITVDKKTVGTYS